VPLFVFLVDEYLACAEFRIFSESFDKSIIVGGQSIGKKTGDRMVF